MTRQVIIPGSEKRGLGGALEDSLEHLLDKGVRKREAAVCTDPVPLGELKRSHRSMPLL